MVAAPVSPGNEPCVDLLTEDAPPVIDRAHGRHFMDGSDAHEKGSLRRKAWTAFWQKALNSGVDRRTGTWRPIMRLHGPASG